MKLNILDRLSFGGILPVGSNMVERVIIMAIEAKVALTEDEVTSASVVVAKGEVGVDPVAAKEIVIDVEFTEAEMVYLRGRIPVMEKANGITSTNFNVCNLIQGVPVGA